MPTIEQLNAIRGLGAKPAHPQGDHPTITSLPQPPTMPASLWFLDAATKTIVKDQGAYGFCYDDRTEVLTKRGWLLFKDVLDHDEIATIDPATEIACFQKPVSYTRFHYTGPMHHFTHRALDLCVTPDHKMLIRKWNQAARSLEDNYQLISAKDVGWYAGLMTCGQVQGEKPAMWQFPVVSGKDSRRMKQQPECSMRDWLRFLGIFIAEGTMYQDGEKYHWRVQVAASKPSGKQYIRGLLERMGVHASEYTDRFSISNKALYLALQEDGLRGCYQWDRSMPSWIWSLDSELIECFLEGLFVGDAWRNAKGQVNYFTTSRKLADDVQGLLLLTGKHASVYSRDRTAHETHIGEQTVTCRRPSYSVHEWSGSKGLSIDRKQDLQIEHYDAEVFCLEVPEHHTLFVRRNGKPVVCGNCVSMAAADVQEAQSALLFGSAPELSPLWVQAWAKTADGDPADQGTWASTAAQQMIAHGVALEKDYPYSGAADLAAHLGTPPDPATRITGEYKVGSYAYQAGGDIVGAVKAALAASGPCMVSVRVTYGWDVPVDGRVTLKQDVVNPAWMRGYHEVACVGYDDVQGAVLIKNSWGESWAGREDGSVPRGYALVDYDWMSGGNSGVQNLYDVTAVTQDLTTRITGDVTGDSYITIADVMRELEWVVGLDKASSLLTKIGDVRGDGKITLADAIALARKTVGL